MAGNGAVPDEGYWIETEKEIDFPPSLALIVRLLEAKDVVTLDGLGGRVPSS